MGLVTASAVLVHVWDGTIEAHFHFFVMIGVLSLYQDWVPFLVAIAAVVLHHGIVGVLCARQRLQPADAVAQPWRWALIHGGFVLAASAANVVAWRTNENHLLRDPLTGLPSRLLFLHRLTGAIERLRRHAAPRGRAVRRPRPLQDHQRLARPSGAATSCCWRSPSGCGALLRRHEMIARFGGDEFAILCEDIRDERGRDRGRRADPEGARAPFRSPTAPRSPPGASASRSRAGAARPRRT